MSSIITSFIFGMKTLEIYGFSLAVPFLRKELFSSSIYLLYITLSTRILFQSSIYSIIMWMLDIWSFEESYNICKLTKDGNKITKEMFFKLLMQKHIPIFSVFNALCKLFMGKSILEYKYHLDKTKMKNPIMLLSKIFIIYISIQLLVSGILYYTDKEIKMIDNIESIEVVQMANSTILKDTSSGQSVYNLNIYLSDGYIHYNKLSYAKEEIFDNLKNNLSFIKNKYNRENGEFQGFNIIIYNDYSKTWDKYMYNTDLSEKYELLDISSNIKDVDIYIKDNTLVYNILTNLSKDEIGWDMAEFLLDEFDTDIEDINIQSKIKNILQNDRKIDKYVVNILSKEYYTSTNNTYFVYIKEAGESSWYYYDNAFFSLEKQQEKFTEEIRSKYKNIKVDYSNLYDTGEIFIYSEKEIKLDIIYKLLKTTKAGKNLELQAKYLGNISNIKFIVKED